ncbi:MAG TPA: protein kinase [Noviherbaspirillum sp.]|uniref:protein kinase domain-containing protein n=1 Tax=Noviherbaspirillum sp. TaxID=1926288 RepID=UPI002D4212F8|nr:protein kinase [Noviherbaspirillum sp.]HYD96171.1 protein kinase [Noviherbaspirillum sp.]
MTNEFNQKTTLRTRRTPFKPSAADSDADHGANVLPVGTHLGEFEILDLIGEGGFGIVYLAYDHSLERQVALKEYMPSGLAKRTTKLAVTVRSEHNAETFTAGLKSFINEARMLAQFDSPSLVKVHRFWEGNGTAYMVMPFYDGITLKQALKQRRVTPSESWIRILLADLIDAIEIIHEGHCLHRDIAPDNILLLKDGRPLLLDFGAARRVIGDLTQCLTAILKPGYAPIEQYADIAGLRQGPWTDIYALAAVVYYLVAGKAPPPAVARMVHDELVPAREVGKGRYSSGFLAVLDKALAVKPEQRYRSIAELRNALDIMDTAPRTLPQADGGWATTVLRTAHPARRQPPPALSQPDPMADMKTRMAPAAAGRAAPKPQRATQQPPRPAAQAPKRRREWPLLAVLLAAGVASGVYLGINRTLLDVPLPWMAGTDRGVTYESSGASEVPEQDAERPPPEPAPSAALPAPPVTPPPAPQASLPPPAPSSAAPSPPPAVTEPPAREAAPPVQEAAPPAQEAAPPAQKAEPAAQEAEPPPPVAKAAPAEPPAARAPETPGNAARPGTPAPPATAAAATARSREDALWRQAGNSDKAGGYEKYLREFPRGRYAEIARLRLESIRQPKPPASPEEARWTEATAQNSVSGYEGYLRRYPKGRYAALARDRLESLRPPALRAERPQPEVPALPAPAASVPPAAKSDTPAAVPAAAAAAASTASAAPAAPAVQDALPKQAGIKPPEPAVPAESKRPPEQSTPPPALEASPAQVPVPSPAPASSGKRTIVLADQTMSGNFTTDPKTGSVSGTGKIVWNNGNQFEGTLVRGSKEGRGKFIWANGQRYSGDWANDAPNGHGIIVFADGSRYEGDVRNGVPHGQGSTRFKSGDVYEGSWVRGKSQGQGRYTWANGSFWEGEFRDDRRTENGRMVFAEGVKAGPAGTNAAAPGGREASGR